jgi:hypothetical protein
MAGRDTKFTPEPLGDAVCTHVLCRAWVDGFWTGYKVDTLPAGLPLLRVLVQHAIQVRSASLCSRGCIFPSMRDLDTSLDQSTEQVVAIKSPTPSPPSHHPPSS